MIKKYFPFLVVLFLATKINVSAQTPITDTNIREAVNLWISDQTSAEATYGHISNWDTSSVTDMSDLFSGKTSFNENIGNWDVSSVTDMGSIFIDALSFNQPIGSWDVSSVTDMHWMFKRSGFNQPIGNWDVSSVITMSGMFTAATSFNQPIGNWDTSSVTDMSGMFEKSGFNQPIGNWDVSSVTNMRVVFSESDFNQSIGDWNVRNVTTMWKMFNGSKFNQNIGSWDVSNVTIMDSMFGGVTLSIENYDSLLNGWASLGTLQSGVNFNGGSSKYCNGESGRNTLINTYGWTITDGDLDCSSIAPLTDENIHKAVNLWVSDQPTAEAIYGHISNWDTSGVTNMFGLFAGLDFNLPIGNWDVSHVTTMSWMFESSNFNQPIGDWDVSSVTDMSWMFENSDFSQFIGNWDVSSVNNMSGMFSYASTPDIGSWDVSNVTKMSWMFSASGNPLIGEWDVSSVTNMKGMFAEAFSFNTDISSWDVSNVTDMSHMFYGDDYGEFNQPIGNWDVSSVKDMSTMFSQNPNFNQPLGNWDVSSVTDMSYMFSETIGFNQNIGNWDVSKVTNMSGMFGYALDFNQNIGNWNVSNVTDMTSMFQGVNLSTVNYAFLLNGWASIETLKPNVNFDGGDSKYCNGESGRNTLINTYGWAIIDGGLDCASITPLTDANIQEAVDLWVSDQANAEATYGHISNWDTSSVTNMFGLFAGLDFNLPIGNWDVSNVTNMSWMFESSNFNQPIGDWDVGSVTNMSVMFENSNFNQPIGNWNVSSVTDMISMFYHALEFDQPIGDWDVSGVTNMSRMFMVGGEIKPNNDGDGFFIMSSFNQDIGNWDVSSVTTMEEMFYRAVVFNQPIVDWDVNGVTNMSGMFKGVWYETDADFEDFNTQFNQDIGSWDVSNVTNMNSMFSNSQFNQDIGNWNVSNVTNMSGMFGKGSQFNKDIGSWDVSSVTDMSNMFSGSFDYGGGIYTYNPFNQNIGSWNVSSVTDMSHMFYLATSFNQPIGNWDVSSVTNMRNMFSGNYGEGSFHYNLFNQNIGSWDVRNVTDMFRMFYLATLSTENYDALLNGWSTKTLQPNVSFSASSTSYCNGETARDNIINNYNWAINDAGKDCTNAAVNCLTVEDANGFVGISNDINLILENTQDIKGFQFDITFPDGFVFNPNAITNTGLPENFQVSCANVGGNSYRVVGFSLTNETIVPGTASILTFPTFINEGALAGDYPIPVTNVTLSDVNNLDISSLCLTDGLITVYTYPVGDSNGDDTVNILDILGTVDYIFDNPPAQFYFAMADVNSDETINILDVLGIQDIILSPAAKTSYKTTKANTLKSLAGNNYLNITSDMFSPNTSETIEINLTNDDIVKGLEFDFVLPEGFTFNPADITGSPRLDGFIVSAQEISQNTYKVLVFSLSAATVAQGTGVVLNLPVFIEPDASIAVYPIALINDIISDTNNTDVSTQAPNIGEITISTLGIDDFEDHENNLMLYPNPARETLYVKTNRKSSYSIIDVFGKLVKTGKLEQGENLLDIKNYQTGIYFLQIKNDSGLITKKVIKE